jgi:uncharacterized protein (DUF2062 family)
MYPLLRFLQRGVTPHKLALTVALGVIVGMLPVFGIAALICALLAFALRLNMAALQLTHYAATPLQVLLFVPFVRLGAVFFPQAPAAFSFSQLCQMFTADPLATLSQVGATLLTGFLGWGLVSIPLALSLYYLTRPVFKRWSARAHLTPLHSAVIQRETDAVPDNCLQAS